MKKNKRIYTREDYPELYDKIKNIPSVYIQEKETIILLPNCRAENLKIQE